VSLCQLSIEQLSLLSLVILLRTVVVTYCLLFQFLRFMSLCWWMKADFPIILQNNNKWSCFHRLSFCFDFCARVVHLSVTSNFVITRGRIIRKYHLLSKRTNTTSSRYPDERGARWFPPPPATDRLLTVLNLSKWELSTWKEHRTRYMITEPCASHWSPESTNASYLNDASYLNEMDRSEQFTKIPRLVGNQLRLFVFAIL